MLVFLPQILILFLFLLFLEDSGYLPRAAFLLDRVMGTRGALGARRSFRCCRALPARCRASWPRARSATARDRLATIMIAPLMTCSARLPVYALSSARSFRERTVGGVFNLQGLVLFVLYVAGIVVGDGRRLRDAARRGHARTQHPLLMELPSYRWPTPAQSRVSACGSARASSSSASAPSSSR